MDFRAAAEDRARLEENASGIITARTPGKGTRLERQDYSLKKSDPYVYEAELNALRLAHELGLPVSDYCTFDEDDEGTPRIVMNFAEVICLEDAWPTLSSTERIGIAYQLREIISKMQAAIPSPYYRIGSCGSCVRDPNDQKARSSMPLEHEDGFNWFILRKVIGAPKGVLYALLAGLRQHSEQSLVFTHADLTPRNIIIEEDRISAIIGWDFAGWYPRYWEYVKFFERDTPCKGWLDLVYEIFPTTYPTELVTHQAIARWSQKWMRSQTGFSLLP